MSYSVYALDLGRSQYKALNLSGDAFSSSAGVVEISPSKWETILERSENPRPDVVLTRGRAFVVGDHASFYGVVSSQNTAIRYAWDNIGIAAISTILQYGHRNQTCDVVISHPPDDFRYKDDLKAALIGEWVVASQNKEVTVIINDVHTEDEPVALLRNLQFTKDGDYRKNTPIKDRSIVLDGGGETMDIAGTDRNMKLVDAFIDNRHIGINHFLTSFEDAIRSRHKGFFSEVAGIDPYAIREAFATGWFVGGGERLDCNAESHQQKQSYMNRVMQFISDRTGGLRNFDVVVVGGGAAGIFQHEWLEYLNHGNVHFADSNFDTIHLAGVHGLMKSYKFWRSQGWV